MPESPSDSPEETPENDRSRPDPVEDPPLPSLGVILGLMILAVLPVTLGTFLRVDSTLVEIDLRARRMAFRFPETAPLGPVLKLRSLDLSGASSLDPLGAVPEWNPGDGPHRLTLTPVDPQPDEGRKGEEGEGRDAEIALGWGLLPAGSRLEIESLPGPGRFRLAYSGPPIEPLVTATGELGVRLDGQDFGTRNLEAHAFELASGEDDLEADFEFSTRGGYALQDPLMIEDPIFLFDQVLNDEQHRIRRPKSSLREGVLHLTELPGHELALRPGDVLTFENALGQARRIELLEEGTIRLQFYGSVRKLRIESVTGVSRNLMPRYLTWLRAQDALLLGWSTMVYLTGLLLGIYFFWRKLRYGTS